MLPRRSLIPIVGLCLAAFCVPSLQAEEEPIGFLLYRSIPSLADRDVRVIEVSWVEEFPQVVNYKLPGGSRKARLFRETVPAVVVYPDLSQATIVTPTEFGELQKQRETLADLGEQFPQCKDLLPEAIATYDEALQKFSDGKICVRGKWLTPQEANRPVVETPQIDSLTVEGKNGTSQTFWNVRVLTIEKDRIRILHSTGSLSIPHEQLPEKYQKLWKFSG